MSGSLFYTLRENLISARETILARDSEIETLHDKISALRAEIGGRAQDATETGTALDALRKKVAELEEELDLRKEGWRINMDLAKECNKWKLRFAILYLCEHTPDIADKWYEETKG